MWPQIVFTLGVAGFFVFTLYETVGLSFLGKVFPIGVASVGLLAALLVLWPQIRGNRASREVFDGEELRKADDDGPVGPLRYMAWLAAFVAAIGLVGYFLALVIFFVAFLRIVGKSSWLQTLILTAAAAGLVMVLANSLNMVMPEGLLQEHYYQYLFWPLR